MKICTGCGENKSFTEFSKCCSKRDQLRSRCRACCKIYSTNYHKYNNKRATLKYHHNLSLEDFEKMKEKQKGLCYICEKSPELGSRKTLFVDHCHKTKKIRGLLCQKCNSGLGMFNDNIELL